MTRTCSKRDGRVVMVDGRAGRGWRRAPRPRTPRPGPRWPDTDRVGGAGVESDLHRHAHRHEHGELLQSSGSGRSFTRRSSMRTTASNGATRRSSFTTRAPAARRAGRRSIAAAYTALVGLFPSQQPALDASYAASLAALSDDCEDRGDRADAARARAHRARHRLGNRGGAGRARLARDRWVQRELPAVHRWDRGRPVAADTAGVRRR